MKKNRVICSACRGGLEQARRGLSLLENTHDSCDAAPRLARRKADWERTSRKPWPPLPVRCDCPCRTRSWRELVADYVARRNALAAELRGLKERLATLEARQLECLQQAAAAYTREVGTVGPVDGEGEFQLTTPMKGGPVAWLYGEDSENREYGPIDPFDLIDFREIYELPVLDAKTTLEAAEHAADPVVFADWLELDE